MSAIGISSVSDAPAAAVALERLRTKLLKKRWPSKGYTSFVPVDEIDKLMNLDNIKQELTTIFGDSPSVDLNRLAYYFHGGSKKLLAIVVCFKIPADMAPQLIPQLIRDLEMGSVTDRDLPFKRIDELGYRLERKSHQCLDVNHQGCGLVSLSRWNPVDVQDLNKSQWEMLAPEFEMSREHQLDDGVILPFTEGGENDPANIRNGGYSEVWPVRIHPAHQKLLISSNPKGPKFAIKRLHDQDERSYRLELEMLRVLAQRNEPHLIKLLATYKLNGRYHFIFPYAKANLRTYWAKVDLPYWNRDTYLWVLQQMRGLVSGLVIIHNIRAEGPFLSQQTNPVISQKTNTSIPKRLQVEPSSEKFGRHGDLKPENILWSDGVESSAQGGVLQITDFGLGRFHRMESRSRVDPRTVGGSATYVPPEISLGRHVSRAYDIWSMGCVFLEFITWLLAGAAGLENFTLTRNATGYDGFEDDVFFTIETDSSGRRGIVRPSVETWISKLREHKRCSPMVSELLTLVHLKMVCIDTQARIKAGELESRLEGILRHGERDSAYLLGLTPPTDAANLGVKFP